MNKLRIVSVRNLLRKIFSMNVLKAGQQIPGQADGGLEFVCLFVVVVVVVVAAVAVELL